MSAEILIFFELFKVENWPTLEHFYLGFSDDSPVNACGKAISKN